MDAISFILEKGEVWLHDNRYSVWTPMLQDNKTHPHAVRRESCIRRDIHEHQRNT